MRKFKNEICAVLLYFYPVLAAPVDFFRRCRPSGLTIPGSSSASDIMSAIKTSWFGSRLLNGMFVPFTKEYVSENGQLRKSRVL
jgi:hypothetical protein